MDFKAILVEGLFYEKEGALFIEDDKGKHVAVSDVLAPVVGHRVQFAVHHLPPNGIELDKPGGGSCYYPGGKGCPALHEERPDRVLSFHMEGVLQGDPWRMEKFDGSVVPIPFGAMPGHYGRIGAATIIDVSKMRDILMDPSIPRSVSGGMDAPELERVLERLKKALEQG